jgi:thioredoxin 1
MAAWGDPGFPYGWPLIRAANRPSLASITAAASLARRPLPQELSVSEHVIHATDADFDATVLQSSEPVLVDFWAPWCGPCKMIAPALDELAGEYAGKVKIAKVNVDENRATALKYHVRSIPMLLLFKGGQVQATQIGAVGKPQLAQLIDKAL